MRNQLPQWPEDEELFGSCDCDECTAYREIYLYGKQEETRDIMKKTWVISGKSTKFDTYEEAELAAKKATLGGNYKEPSDVTIYESVAVAKQSVPNVEVQKIV